MARAEEPTGPARRQAGIAGAGRHRARRTAEVGADADRDEHVWPDGAGRRAKRIGQFVLGRQYRIVAANAAYRERFAPTGAVIGRCCYEVSHHYAVPCDQAGESCPLARARESGRRERVLHLHHTPQGKAYVDIELSPLVDANGDRAFYVEKMLTLQGAHSEPAAEALIGRSPAFRQMLELVTRVGPTKVSVLLLGESGTGKELVARAIHKASPRAGRPLVVVDCASLPETLFESELFGHERGGFTGATSAKPGLVESASGGTLFLDEVGDIPLAMQVKLLRLLESGTYRRVGSTELRRADVRLISATHRDLRAMIAAGQFRQDPYYRLATFPLRLPALRERPEDVPLLARALLARVAPERQINLSTRALARLSGYPFPGNVRELRNVIERATLLTDGSMIEVAHVEQALSLSEPLHPTAEAADAKQAIAGNGLLRDLEDETLLTALRTHADSRGDLA